MSDTATTSEQATELPFRADEIREFDEADAEAGQAIGKMLSLFFLYTVIVMAISAYCTYYWVTNPSLQ